MLTALVALAVLTLGLGVAILIITRRTSMKVDDILAKVQAQKTVMDSAVTLLGSLSQAIKDAGTDPAKLQAISDAIDANTTELSDALTANTPAATA